MRSTVGLVCFAITLGCTGAAWSDEAPASRTEPAGPWRVSVDELDTRAWREAVKRLTATGAIQSGRTPVTLVRVVLAGLEPLATEVPEVDLPTVNGVRLRVTGGDNPIDWSHTYRQPSQAAPRKVPIAATSTKLNTLDSFPQGGGMYQQINSGDFIIVEHINSSSRRGGKDPVRIRTATHGQANLWVPVPPRGELGLFGDVVLEEIDRSTYGRIVADVRSSGTYVPRPARLQVGLVTVGGPYGDSYPMAHDSIAATGLLAPGDYQILLPTNETSGTPTNRWTIKVQPSRVTYLVFRDPGEGEIELLSKVTIPASNQPTSLAPMGEVTE